MTQTTLARPHAPKRSFPPLTTVLLAVVGALLCLGMTVALRNPKVVPHVTVVNPSSMPISVDVRGAADGRRLILDTVAAGTRATTLDVVDQGDKWIFGFASAGIDGGSVTVSRAKLAADGWQLRVPEPILDRIRARSFVPAYR